MVMDNLNALGLRTYKERKPLTPEGTAEDDE